MAASNSTVAEFTRVGQLAKLPAPVTMTEEQLQAIRAEAKRMVEGLDQVRVVDAATYTKADQSRLIIKRARDFIRGKFKDPKEAADKLHKWFCSQERSEDQPLVQLDARLDSEMRSWRSAEQERKREAERQAAEEERQRLQAAALEEAAAISDTAPEMADQIVEQALAAPLPSVVLQDTIPETQTSFRKNWQFAYIGALQGQEWKHLSEEERQRVMQLLPREYLMPDESKIGKVVKALEGSTKIPGIIAYDKGSSQVRG